MATRQPSAAKAAAVAKPIPWLDAATRATRVLSPKSMRCEGVIINGRETGTDATVRVVSVRAARCVRKLHFSQRTREMGHPGIIGFADERFRREDQISDSWAMLFLAGVE